MLGITSLIFYFINICENTDDESFIHEDINVDETVIDNDNTEIELSSAEPIYHKSNKVILTEFSESDSEDTVSSNQLESESIGSESRGLKRKLNLDEPNIEDLTYELDIEPDTHASKKRIYRVEVENKSIENHIKGNSHNSDAAMHPSNGK